MIIAPMPTIVGDRLAWLQQLDEVVAADMRRMASELTDEGWPAEAIESMIDGYSEWLADRFKALGDQLRITLSWDAA